MGETVIQRRFPARIRLTRRRWTALPPPILFPCSASSRCLLSSSLACLFSRATAESE